MPEQHPIIIKKELIAKIRARYRDYSGDPLPQDYTDDEVLAAAIVFLFEECFL